MIVMHEFASVSMNDLVHRARGVDVQFKPDAQRGLRWNRLLCRLVDGSAGNGWRFVSLLDQLLQRGQVHVFELLDVET